MSTLVNMNEFTTPPIDLSQFFERGRPERSVYDETINSTLDIFGKDVLPQVKGVPLSKASLKNIINTSDRLLFPLWKLQTLRTKESVGEKRIKQYKQLTNEMLRVVSMRYVAEMNERLEKLTWILIIFTAIVVLIELNRHFKVIQYILEFF